MNLPVKRVEKHSETDDADTLAFSCNLPAIRAV